MLEKIIFKVDGKEISLTAEEARSLYADLKKLFEPVSEPALPKDTLEDWLKKRDPWKPPLDWTIPWTPYQPYGPVTYDGNTNLGPPKPGEVIWLKGDTEK